MLKHRRLTISCWLMKLLPDLMCLNSLRIRLLRWAGVVVGSRCQISGSVIVKGWGRLEIGDDVRIRDNVIIQISGGEIQIGNRVLIGAMSLIESISEGQTAGHVMIGNDVDIMMSDIVSANGSATVSIGDHCKIAHLVSIKATHHEIDPLGDCIGGRYLFDDIALMEGSWVCAGATIIPGVRIGRKNVIAAGAVVTKDTPDGVLMAGVPATIKKCYI